MCIYSVSWIKKFYEGSEEETLEFKWGIYISQWISSQTDNA